MLLNRRFLLGFSLLVFCLSAVQAEKVYRSVDETGVVEFSDQEQRDAEEVKVQKVPTYNFKKTERTTPAPSMAAESAQLQAEIMVVSPADQETIRSNQGDVTVVVKLTDRTAQKNGKEPAGDKIVIIMDGKTLLETDKTTIVLHNIDRGTHQLKARLVDAGGKSVAESQTVEFYMKRFSKLFKKPVNPVKTK